MATPFLPGYSLLFAVGALCGVGSLDLLPSVVVLLVAAILGDTVNYWIGYWTGPKVFRQKTSRWFNPSHLERAHEFTERYGGKAVVLARFVPIVRTFVPFVTGIGRMTYFRFMSYNVGGGVAWVLGFVLAGFYFGNIPAVKRILRSSSWASSPFPCSRVIEYLRFDRRAASRQGPNNSNYRRIAS